MGMWRGKPAATAFFRSLPASLVHRFKSSLTYQLTHTHREAVGVGAHVPLSYF